MTDSDYEKEAAELLARYTAECKKERIKVLNQKLKELDEDDEAYESIVREITDLQKS